MKRKGYKKVKSETLGQKVVNILLTVLLACLISSQVCTAAGNNLRIAQISDPHFSSFEDNTSYKFLKKSPELLDDAIFQINTSGAYDFVIFTGDLVNTPQVGELNKVLMHINKLVYPWYAIDGNHDISVDGGLTKQCFLETLKDNNKRMNFDKIYYAFTPKRGFRVICLDSIIDKKITTNGEIPADEMKWLKGELDEHAKDVIIICTHVPINEPFSSPNHRLKNEVDVKSLLRSYDNPIIVLQGHYHAARAEQKGNVIYISSPSLVTFPNGFRVININSNRSRTLVDVFLKETGLKDVQSRARIRVMGTDLLYGKESDRNTSFEIKKIRNK